MDLYKFRSKARVVAIVDLILSSMSLCICLILLLGAVVLSTTPVSQEDGKWTYLEMQKQEKKDTVVTLLWFLVIFTSIATIIQILAAIKLLNATQLGKEPHSALKLCVFWRHVCMVFTILLMISIFFNRVDNSSAIFTIIQILLRAWAIFIVTQFMKELEASIATGVLPTHCQSGTTPIIAGVAYAYIPPNQQQQQNQIPKTSDMNEAPPSYHEVVKEASALKQ